MQFEGFKNNLKYHVMNKTKNLQIFFVYIHLQSS
jgi:hypothetical protein